MTINNFIHIELSGRLEDIFNDIHRYMFPISAVDAYYGGNSFSKKWKPLLPKNIVEFKNSYGICKYKINL